MVEAVVSDCGCVASQHVACSRCVSCSVPLIPLRVFCRLQQGNSPWTGCSRGLTRSCGTPWDAWAPTRRIALASLLPSPAWRAPRKQVDTGLNEVVYMMHKKPITFSRYLISLISPSIVWWISLLLLIFWPFYFIYFFTNLIIIIITLHFWSFIVQIFCVN